MCWNRHVFSFKPYIVDIFQSFIRAIYIYTWDIGKVLFLKRSFDIRKL